MARAERGCFVSRIRGLTAAEGKVVRILAEIRIALVFFVILFSGWVPGPLETFHLGNGMAHAQTALFYQGKTIRLIEGFGVGGASDLWARLIARYMSSYIPGSPDIIVQSMPGAGGVIAANYVYNVAKPDGLTVGMVLPYLVFDQVVGRQEVKFDYRKFQWVGTQEKYNQVLYMRADAPFKSVGDIIKAKEPPKCGGSGTISGVLNNVLEETLGTKFNMVLGYRDGPETDLGVERGEVVCRAMDLVSHFVREPFVTWHKTGFDRHLVQTPRKRDPRTPDTPTIWELMDTYKTPEVSRRVAQTVLAGGEFGRPMMAPPGAPEERVKILREAYARAMRDPGLIAEAKKSRLDMDPSTGEDLQALANEVLNQPAEVVERVKKILGQ
jgi:tripartite-type tricarboxylate transporter receptor subunit TctC